MNCNRIFGLTGGIGSGKSSVSRILSRQYGFAIVDADRLTRVAHAQREVCDACAACFGVGVVQEENGAWRIDRRSLSKIVFGNAENLAKLDRIMRPALEALLRSELDFHAGAGRDSIVDAALLFEASWDRFVQRVIVVTAPCDLRMARVMARDGMDRLSCERRMAAQMGEGERCRRADWILYNVGDEAMLSRQVACWYATLSDA